MNRVLLVLAALLAGSGAPAAEPAEFSVATYNICWGNMDLREMAASVRKADADLVLLQETTAPSEAWLRRQLRDRYPQMLFRGDKGQYPAERFGILSKSPVGGLKFLPARHGLFGAWIGRTRLGGRSVQIVNVHLQPGFFQRGESLWDVLKVYQRLEETHGREIRHLQENLAADVPTIVAGDLNSLSSFVAPRFLVEKGFIDSFASVTQQPDDHPTWRWPVGRGELALRLDYIFHSREFKTIESEVLVSPASDHSLLVSRLRWEAGEKPGAEPREDQR